MRAKLAVIALVLVLLAPRASADLWIPPSPVYLHIAGNSTLRTDVTPGTDVRLPPGYFMDEPTHAAIDLRIRELEDDRTRLTAENAVMRDRLEYHPGWVAAAVTLLVGISVGVYAAEKW